MPNPRKIARLAAMEAEDSQSPYTSSIVTVKVGQEEEIYRTYMAFVARYPKLKDRASGFDRTISLPEVKAEAGHAFLHFIATDLLETSPIDTGSLMDQYFIAMLVYDAAKQLDMLDLEQAAKTRMAQHVRGLSVLDLQRVMERHHSDALRQDTWYNNHVGKSVKRALVENQELLASQSELVRQSGGNAVFDRAVLRTVCTLYNKICRGEGGTEASDGEWQMESDTETS